MTFIELNSLITRSLNPSPEDLALREDCAHDWVDTNAWTGIIELTCRICADRKVVPW